VNFQTVKFHLHKQETKNIISHIKEFQFIFIAIPPKTQGFQLNLSLQIVLN